jgi:hypothetical protein
MLNAHGPVLFKAFAKKKPKKAIKLRTLKGQKWAYNKIYALPWVL